MSRTSSTFNLLQAVAAVAALAILLWSLGLPSLRFAEAANVTSLSNTLSDSAPNASSTHTITFVTPTGVANGETITVSFADGPFVIGAVDFTDIDVQDDTTDLTVAADCTGSEQIGASFTGTLLTLEFCATGGASIGANGTTTIEIGTNATFGTAGDRDIVNPGTIRSYEINITAGNTDIGETRVAIIASVTVSASVDTTFSFTVTGVAPGVAVNGGTTTGSTTAIAIPFGELQAGVASTAAQNLAVATNASNGFVVTVQVDQQLQSATGADIDGFANGSYVTTPIAWTGPTPSVGNEDTYGHWGLTTEDETLGDSLTDLFGSELYASASTTPVEVFRHNGPADGETPHIGLTRVGYRAEISALQEAGNDYTATLTYVATPVF